MKKIKHVVIKTALVFTGLIFVCVSSLALGLLYVATKLNSLMVYIDDGE